MKHSLPKSLRLAFYLNSMAGGGAERVFALIASHLASEGDQIDLILDRARGPNISLLDPAVRVIDLDSSSLGAVRKLRAHIKQFRPDVVIAGHPHCNLVASAALLGTDIPLVTTVHSVTGLDNLLWPSTGKFAALGILLEPIVFRAADAIGVVSASIAKAKNLHGAFPNKVRVLHNCVDLDVFAPDPAKSVQDDRKRKLIISAGRLAAPKDFVTVLQAFALVEETIVADLMIVGEGPDRAELERLICKLGLVHVSMPGYVSNIASAISSVRSGCGLLQV